MKLFFVILGLISAPFTYSSDEAEMVKAKVKEVNTMRESLVKAVSGKVTPETFKAVCAPVGLRAKAIAKEQGWTFRQAAVKYRNPQNKATDIEAMAILRLEKEEEDSFFEKDSKTGKTHYFERIVVRQACLNCHGAKDSRPDFIKKKFPNDRAWGFSVGDLRGIYHVTY